MIDQNILLQKLVAVGYALVPIPIGLGRQRDRCRHPAAHQSCAQGLGRGLAQSGRLDADATEFALATLVRFVSLARAMAVAHIDAVATAAVREAEDGGKFTDQVGRELIQQLIEALVIWANKLRGKS